MNDGLIPNRYAKALMKVAAHDGTQDSVYEQTKQLEASYAATPGLKAAVNNPFIAVDEKCKLLLTASGAPQGGTLDRFIRLVIDKNRIDFMRSIALAYTKLYRQASGIACVEIASATQLPQKELDQITDVVKRQLGSKTTEMKVTVDPSLIGGFTVNVDGQVLDASVKTELKKLRLKLLS